MAPQPVGPNGGLSAQMVLNRALNMMVSSNENWYNQCQRFVRTAFGSAGGAATALDAWQAARYKTRGGNPPPGAAVYWGGGAGHVAVSAGNGWVITTDFGGKGKISLARIADITQTWGKPYLGWSSDNNEKRIIKFNAQPVDASGRDFRAYQTSGSGGGAGMARTRQTADYGWADAVFNANPELKALLRKAKANDWDGATMQAAIRGTDWYRNHSKAWRETWVQKKDSPESFARDRAKMRSSIDAMANQWGVNLTDAQRNKIAHDAMWLGLSDDEMNDAIGNLFHGGGDYSGKAGDIQDQVTQMAADYGVKVSDHYIQGLVRGIIKGDMTEQDAQNHITELAKSTYAALAPQIDAGMTVKQIADPYIRSMAGLLEIPDGNINLMDPTIRKALTTRDQTGAPTVKPIWKFEQEMRNDPRWFKTNNARDSIMGIGNQVLKMWGVAG